jgi:hypothetical protein
VLIRPKRGEIENEKRNHQVDESFPFIHTFWYPISRNPFTSLLVYWYFHLMLRQVSHLVNSLSFYSIDIQFFVSTCTHLTNIQNTQIAMLWPFPLQIPQSWWWRDCFEEGGMKGQHDAFRLTLTLCSWIFYVRNYNKLSDLKFSFLSHMTLED